MVKSNLKSEDSYFDRMEAVDAKLLVAFNEQVKWFDGLSATTKGTPYDFNGTDKKGRLVHIELKKRKGKVVDYAEDGKYGDIFIEPTKLGFFTRMAESGYTLNERRLYINFVDDGVIIFPLDEMKGARLSWHPNHHHQNYGKNGMEYEDRIGLPLESAVIWMRDNDNEYQQYYPIKRYVTEMLTAREINSLEKYGWLKKEEQ